MHSQSGPPTREIRPISPGDLAGLVDFFIHVYPSWQTDRTLAERYYQWKYFDQRGRDTGLPSGFLAEDESGIIGFIGALPFMVMFGGISSSAGWIADWHLVNRVRGRGIGRALLESAMASLPALACVNGTADAERLYKEHGFRAWPSGKSWKRITHPLSYEWPRRSGVRRIIGAYPALQHTFRNWIAPSFGKTFTMRADVPLQEIAEILNQESYDGLIRTTGYYAWLMRCPVANVKAHLMTDGNEDAGYVITQSARDYFGRTCCRVLDIGFRDIDGDLLKNGLVSAFSLLHEHFDPDYIEVRAPVQWEPVLQKLEYVSGEENRFWLRHSYVNDMDPAKEWRISFVDKDDAFRGFSIVP